MNAFGESDPILFESAWQISTEEMIEAKKKRSMAETLVNADFHFIAFTDITCSDV